MSHLESTLPAGLMSVLRLSIVTLAFLTSAEPAQTAPVRLFEQKPVQVTNVAPGVVLVDFGRVAFGNLQLAANPGFTNRVTVHFGEAFAGGRIDRKPPGTVRYAHATGTLRGVEPLVIAPPANARNTETSGNHPPAVLTPAEWGVVLPFRWVEVENWPGELLPEHITRRAAFPANWDEDAAWFRCDDDLLNRIWELCRYSIKATAFAGIYVDGDRERIPYEADAYLNQLSHYYTDTDTQMARDTFDWLMKHPTWPTEWAPHMVFMAHADWMQTGDTHWLASHIDALRSKTLLDRAGPDGLIQSNPQQMKRDDIVDWPQAERDGYVLTPVNTVVNAFHLRALGLMAQMTRALGKAEEAQFYADRERKARSAFNERLFDVKRGCYRDGAGTEHASLHANLFPLAFDLVPEANRGQVARWVADRGMRCSVYAAQYLLEGLFKNGLEAEAIELMTARNDRSWRHMVESGTTITWEAWDQKYKPNQDWNHAWGAAPANLLPRYIVGVQPLTPGWEQVLICPRPGKLMHAEGRIPTPRGPVGASWTRKGRFALKVALPEGMSARVELPAPKGSQGILLNGEPIGAQRTSSRWVLENISGKATLQVR